MLRVTINLLQDYRFAELHHQTLPAGFARLQCRRRDLLRCCGRLPAFGLLGRIRALRRGNHVL